MPVPPVASVVIPVRGRRDSLGRLLDSLCAQHCAARLEVIVVDNPRPVNRQWLRARSWPFQVKHDHLPVPNRGKARNAGAAMASSDWLIFVDSDVVLSSPSTIDGLVTTATSDPQSAAMADMHFPPGEPRTLASHFLDVPAFFRRYRRAARSGPLTFREFVSCAFAVNAETFHRVGRFDEGFEHYGYEDVEFAFRAASFGCHPRLATQRAYHHKRLTPGAVLGHATEAGRSAVRLTRLHPQVEQHLPLGIEDTLTGRLRFGDDFDLAGVLSDAQWAERRWATVRGLGDIGEARRLLGVANTAYSQLHLFGRYSGITAELTEVTT